MNLHGIVSGAIGAINPNEVITIRISVGSTIEPDAMRTMRSIRRSVVGCTCSRIVATLAASTYLL